MANTRKSRVPKEEQLKLINECRISGEYPKVCVNLQTDVR